MKKGIILATLLILGLALSCQWENETAGSTAPISDQSIQEKGLQVLQQQCVSCHSPNPEIEKPIAPSLATIKTAYLAQAKEGPAFSALMQQFLAKPSAENSLLDGAIEQYGVMPIMNLSAVEVKALASYIYQNPVETVAWYEQEYQQALAGFMEKEEALNPLERGKQLARQTKGVLGKNLLNAIKTQGTEYAVAFCNTRAYPLTDSMALAMNAEIKRVSDKNRNPQNKANARQLAYIDAAKDQLAQGQAITPQMYEDAGKVEAYYPILTNAMCLNCHGDPSEMDPGTLGKIQELYPEDQAMGYGENELRGIWVVEMDKKSD